MSSRTDPPDIEDVAAAFEAMSVALARLAVEFAEVDPAEACRAIRDVRVHVHRNMQNQVRNERVWQLIVAMLDGAVAAAERPPPPQRRR